MCGITAFSLAEKSSIHDIRSFARCAVMAIEHRGTDATGFGWTAPDGRGRYWKDAVTAHLATLRAPLPREATVMLGHTRFGTSGPKRIMSNNHPVIDDGIMLIHNGVVTNEYSIYKMFDLPVPKDTVDTAALALLLANREYLQAEHPVDVLTIPTGSAAIAWIDTADPHVLHLARLQDRPLTIAWTRKKDLVMSSTPDTLAHLSLTSNIKFRNVTEIREGAYMRIESGVITEVKEFKPKTYSSGYTGTYGAGTYGSRGAADYTSKPTGELVAITGGKDDAADRRRDAITIPFDQDDIDRWDICRWDIEDIEVPANVPFNPTAIREWRNECTCRECESYEEMNEAWQAAASALKEGVDEYVYKGQRMVWNREAGDYLPADDDVESVIDDNDAVLIAEDR